MFQILVISDELQLVLDNLLEILLDLIVGVLYGLLHAVIAIGILEVIDDGDRLIVAFLPLDLLSIHNNLGMEYFLLNALAEVVGNWADEHTLGKTANLAWRNKTVHLCVDGSGNILSIDGNGLAFLKNLSETLG